MGKSKPVLLIVAAVIVALVTSLLIFTYLQKKTTGKQATLEIQTISVAIVDLAWGTVLKKEMIRTEPYLKESLPAGYFADPASLAGRVLISPVKAREPILDSKLAPTNITAGGVAAVVSPKKRAVAVKVDKVIGVAGFVHPGNRVDVLVTISTQKITEPITKVVLENILVLAAGPEIEKKGKDEKPTQVDVITLEVTPEEAEKLALSATEGKLQLALRNFTDTDDVLTKGINIPSLLASYSDKGTVIQAKANSPRGIQAKKQPNPQKSAAFAVEVIRGGKLSTVKFE